MNLKKTTIRTSIIFALLLSLNIYSAYGRSDSDGAGDSDAKRGKVFGIVLSGGGALGYAHIGVLHAFEEEGFNPQYVAGASMGAVIAAFYSNGMTALDIMKMARDEKFYKTSKIISITVGLDKLGMSSHKHVSALLDKYIPHNSFDSLERKLYVSATNLNTQRSEIISEGDRLKEYVLASSSIPGVFEAIDIDGIVYVDGGVLNNFPAQAIRNKCDVLIGVDVQPYSPKMKLNNVIDVSLRSLYTLVNVNSLEGRGMCDYLIDSYAINDYTIFDFNKIEEIYLYGYNLGKKYLQEHPELLEWIRQAQPYSSSSSIER